MHLVLRNFLAMREQSTLKSKSESFQPQKTRDSYNTDMVPVLKTLLK
jgi:hypothetical protein